MNRDDRFANLGLRDDTDVRGGGVNLEVFDNVAVIFRSSGPRAITTIEYGKRSTPDSTCIICAHTANVFFIRPPSVTSVGSPSIACH